MAADRLEDSLEVASSPAGESASGGTESVKEVEINT